MGEEKDGEGKGGYRTQVTVALITLAGVVATAVAPNWDKIFPHDKGDTPTPIPMPTPTSVPTPAPEPTPSPGPAPVPTGTPAPAPPLTSAASLANISGWWADAEGFRYQIVQSGNAYQYQQGENGVVTAYGQGQINGATIRQSYISQEGAGECAGTIGAGGTVMSGTCSVAGESWPFRLVRS